MQRIGCPVRPDLRNYATRVAVVASIIGLFALSTPLSAEDGSGWRLDPGLEVAARVVTAESAVRDDEDTVDNDAVAVRISPSISLANDDVTVTLRNSTTRVEYFADDRADRWQNIARLTGDFALGGSSTLHLFGERSDNLSTAEGFSTDEWEFGGRIESEFDSANRVRLGGSWRERDYDDLSGFKGRGPRIDGEYRYRLAANHYINLRGRYEEIDSDDPQREMSRWSLFASYQRPIARDLRIRPEIAYRDLDYPGRFVTPGIYRRDNVLTPEITLLYSPGPWLIIAEARYIIRDSSDPEFDENGYRLALEVIRAF